MPQTTTPQQTGLILGAITAHLLVSIDPDDNKPLVMGVYPTRLAAFNALVLQVSLDWDGYRMDTVQPENPIDAVDRIQDEDGSYCCPTLFAVTIPLTHAMIAQAIGDLHELPSHTRDIVLGCRSATLRLRASDVLDLLPAPEQPSPGDDAA